MSKLVDLQNQRFTSSTKINQELSRIISLMLRDFIANWYKSLTNDKDLYSELIQTISLLLQEIERRLDRVEWVGLLTHDLPRILLNHIRDYKNCCAKVGTSYAGTLTFEELFYGLQPHTALDSVENEKEYMRRVAEIIVDCLIPEHELQSDGVRLLLRELVCNNVLLLLVEKVSEPDFINELLLTELCDIVLESPQSDFSRDEYSEQSEVPYSDNESHLAVPTTPTPTIISTTDTLFRVKEKSFLRRRRQKSDPSTNLFTNGLNKLTFGGLDRVSLGIDKIKDFVNHSPGSESLTAEKRKKKRDSKRAGEIFHTASESEMDFSPQPTNSNPPPLPILKMDEQKPLNRVDIPPVPAIVVTDVTVPKKPDGIVQIVKNTTSAIWKLHWECRNGPWKLGPINTTIYERFHLEENILELLEEILQVQNHHRWIYVQLQFFIKPVLYAVGGHVINRAVLRGIHSLISEDSITKYLVLFRESFWPNDQPCPPNPIRSESEKARIRQLLEDSISLKIKGISL